GETRHRLPDNLDQVADTKIHELIREYVDNRTRLSEEEADVILVNKMSSYILRDLRPRLSADLKKELNGVEAASNILSLAKKVQAKWSEYETADEAGQSKFVKVKFHLLIGRAEYGGARGKVEGGLFGLNERLARQLAQRELFRGQGLLANGVGYVGNAISDLGLYAGAYLAGAGVAAAKFGVKTPVAGLFTVFTGGLGGTTGAAFMNMLKEGGLVYETPFGGREGVLHGFGGRYTSEFSQLSRENASSREDPANTRRRTELRQALVPPKEFATIVSAVDGLLQKESLTADEQKELMWQLAELKARLRLTDLTSRRDGLKMGIPQNYIKFSEGQESQQMTELRSRLVEGRVKLARDQSAAALVAGFDTNVALMEGQLRIGNQRERLVNWLHREGHFADAQEALRFFDNNFKDIGITTGESLEAKMKKLKWLNRGHAFISATQVMLFSPFIGAGMNAVIGEGVSALSHLQQGGLGGIGKYFQDWGDTIGGNPPVTTVGGHLTSALSPLQKATLTVHNILAPPPDLTGVHDTLINGVKVQMPGSLRYQADGSGHSYLVDIRDGKVTDMSNYHLSTTSTGALAVGASKDLTGDGVINSEDNVIAESGFAKVMSDNGITISRGPDEITNTVAHLIKTGSVHEQVVDFHGTQIKMELPDGKLPNGDLWRAEWREYSPGKWDLVAFDQSTHDVVKLTDGRPVVFFKDVSFDFQHGKYNYDTDPNHSFAAKMNLNFTEQHVGGGKVVVIDNQGKGSGEWFRHETAIDNRHWHPEDRLKLYNWKVEGSGSDKAVVLDITSVGTVQSHGDQAKVGVYISLPGFSKQGIFVPAEHTNGHLQVRLDPNSTVKLANGWTVGDLSKAILNQDALKTFEHASELTDRRDIFNLGLDGKYGTIEAVSLEKTAHGMVAHVGATILGKSDITKVIDGPGGNIKIPQISLKDGIDDIVKTTTPTFKMDGPPINMDLHFIPLPMRSNIERSVKAGTGEQSRQPAPGSGNGTPPAITTLGQGSTNLSSPLFDQGEMGQVLNGAGISLENAAQNGFTNEAQKVQEAAARYERAKREKRSDEDLTAASAELMEALEILNKAEAKKENDEKKRSGQSQARSDKELEEGVAKKTLGQFTQINAVIETAIETKIKETTRPLTLPSVDGEPDLNAIRQQYRDRRDETLTRWGRQLDQDLAGAASSSLRRGLSTDEFRNRWDGKTPADFGNDTAKKDFLAKRYSAHYLAEMKKMITAVEEKNIAGQVRAALADEDSRIVGNIDLVRQARPVATAQADAEIAGLTNPTLDQRAAIVLRAIETGGPPIARLTRRLSRKTNRESVKKYLELKDRMKVKVQEELAKPEVQNRINQRSLRIEEQIGVWESEVGNPPRFPGLMQALKAKEAGLGEAAFAQKLERLKTQFNTLLALSNVDMQERIKSWYASLYSRLSPGSPVEVTVQADGTFRVKVGNLVDNIHSKAEAAKMLIADQIENEIYEQIYLTSASPGSVRQQTDSDRTAALNSYELLKTRYHVQPLTDGYWHYYFGQAGDQTLQTPFLPKPHGRIYLNTLSTFAPPVMLKIIEKLEESNRGKISTDKIKVQMKMVSPDKLLPLMQGNNPYDDQFRPDKIVLYFDQKDTEYIVHLIKEIYGDTQLNPGFSPSGRTPFLAGVLKGDDGRPMRGVAFAEEPPHDKKSYGEIVATALTNLVAQAAVDRATITNDYIDSNLDKKLEEIGLDPAHPFLFRQDRNSQFQSQVRVFLESNVINYGGSG
ncbi:hypothetical protein HY214_03785, partial [Candidatus Roizmanbacteria bacterium]|nr:hypothetical protein [Candidatus Roizmanbacteria bacterium]